MFGLERLTGFCDVDETETEFISTHLYMEIVHNLFVGKEIKSEMNGND